MLMGLPPHIMAATGIDAMTHAVEAYTCKLAVPHTDAYALYAIKLISKNLRNAVITVLWTPAPHDAGQHYRRYRLRLLCVAAVHCMAKPWVAVTTCPTAWLTLSCCPL